MHLNLGSSENLIGVLGKETAKMSDWNHMSSGKCVEHHGMCIKNYTVSYYVYVESHYLC